jgi:hypothetical protein
MPAFNVAVPTGAPSTRNWTLCTGERVAVAVALNVTVPVTLDPFMGEVRATVGGVESGLSCWRTVTVLPVICN